MLPPPWAWAPITSKRISRMKVRGDQLPDDLYYHPEHTWVKVEGDKVRVGLNDFAQAAAGDITYIDLPFEGDEVEAGETCGKIQSSKWVGKLIAPVSGEIVEVNSELENDATLVNKDCYGEGWFIVIEARQTSRRSWATSCRARRPPTGWRQRSKS